MSEVLSRYDIKGYSEVCVSARQARAKLLLPQSFLPPALQDAIPIIQPLHTPHTRLVLDDFIMKDGLASAVNALVAAGWSDVSFTDLYWPIDAETSTPLPPLNTLHLYTLVPAQRLGTDRSKARAPLDDRMVAQLRKCVTAARVLSVAGVRLTRGVAEGTVLPWRTTRVRSAGDVNLVEWAQQATLLGKTEWDFSNCPFLIELEADGVSKTCKHCSCTE